MLTRRRTKSLVAQAWDVSLSASRDASLENLDPIRRHMELRERRAFLHCLLIVAVVMLVIGGMIRNAAIMP